MHYQSLPLDTLKTQHGHFTSAVLLGYVNSEPLKVIAEKNSIIGCIGKVKINSNNNCDKEWRL